MVFQIYQGRPSFAAACQCWVVGNTWPVLFLQDVANRSFMKSHALYKTVDNRKTLEQQNILIAKWLDESLTARNKLYEANRKHHLEVVTWSGRWRASRKRNQSSKKKGRSSKNNCRLLKPVSISSFVLCWCSLSTPFIPCLSLIMAWI